jgi:hypothetical protein
MGDLFSCIDTTPFQRSQLRSGVAYVRDGAVTVAVVSSLVMNTFIAIAAVAGPITRSFAGAEIRTQFSNSVDQGVRAGNGANKVNVVPLQSIK